MMMEIGGYIEFEHYYGSMLHEKGIALNCGRNCLAYLIRSRQIKKLKVPYFICDSICNVCKREGVEIRFYHIESSFHPDSSLELEGDEWLYLVNFYGQLHNNDIQDYVAKYGRVIVDQAHDYFADPLPNVDTLYTCRKWFGVADGAILYTNSLIKNELIQDESYERMLFLLGRFERNASEFYAEYKMNNALFNNQPIKRMSKLTKNLLRGIDYENVRQRRMENFSFLHKELKSINHLNLKKAAFMYPLMVENGVELRKNLQKEKIYVPMLWPNVCQVSDKDSLEYKMAEDILPLPIDQRYGDADMGELVNIVLELLGGK